MNLEIKAKWLEGLRSGLYKQGQKYLRHKTPNGGDCFCCLGVLVDILDPRGWCPMTGRDVIGAHQGCQGYPARALIERAGLTDEQVRQLARLNDHGVPFPEIANMIERDL